MLAKFWGLMPKVPYLSLEKEKEIFCVVFTYSIKRVREIATTAKKCTKKARCMCKVVLLPIYTYCIFAVSSSPLQKLPILEIQKFCYHGNVTSHFSSL